MRYSSDNKSNIAVMTPSSGKTDISMRSSNCNQKLPKMTPTEQYCNNCGKYVIYMVKIAAFWTEGR